MTLDEFKKNVLIGWFNCGEYLSVTLYYKHNDKKLDKQVKLMLNPPANQYMELNIELAKLHELCSPAMCDWYNELNKLDTFKPIESESTENNKTEDENNENN